MYPTLAGFSAKASTDSYSRRLVMVGKSKHSQKVTAPRSRSKAPPEMSATHPASKASSGSSPARSGTESSPRKYEHPPSGLVEGLMSEGGFTREEAEDLSQVI